MGIGRRDLKNLPCPRRPTSLTNLQLQYRRDADGKLIDGNPAQAGVQPVAITTDPLAVAKLTRLPLANVVDTTYGDFYPSVNATLTLRENLLLRLGYAHTIGRPTLAQLIPTTSVTEVTSPAENASGSGSGTISTSNPTLKPWSGRNHDVAFEYYTRAGGLFSVSVYRRDVTDFISSASVFANYSRHRITGVRAGDFTNGQTRRFNAGVQFAYQALSMSANYSWTGLRRGAISGIAPNAFGYTRPRQLVSVSAEYLVRRNTSLYFTISNLLNNPVANEAYGTDTPAYARLRPPTPGSPLTVKTGPKSNSA